MVENIIADMINIIEDLGFSLGLRAISQTTTMSPLDDFLELLRRLLDDVLPIVGPLLGLNDTAVNCTIDNFNLFVADCESLEHGTLSISDGLKAIVTDLLECFKCLGLDYTNPTDPTPTSLDDLLDKLEAVFDQLLDSLEKILGLTDDQVAAAEADFDKLVQDIKAGEHGTIDVDTTLENILTDVLNILKDCGLPILPGEDTMTTNKLGDVDSLLEALEHQIDVILNALSQVLPFDDGAVVDAENDLHQLVDDLEALAHGTVNIIEGLKAVVQDVSKIAADVKRF